jgi:hypothetical protein
MNFQNAKDYMDKIRREQLDQLEDKKMPSLAQMGKNLLQTASDVAKSVVAGESITEDSEAAKARLAICEQCEFYVNSRCTKCGCYMAVKTHVKAANCPVGKW